MQLSIAGTVTAECTDRFRRLVDLLLRRPPLTQQLQVQFAWENLYGIDIAAGDLVGTYQSMDPKESIRCPPKCCVGIYVPHEGNTMKRP
jgi:hypothetical protein